MIDGEDEEEGGGGGAMYRSIQRSVVTLCRKVLPRCRGPRQVVQGAGLISGKLWVSLASPTGLGRVDFGG
jgi:hypothetical protein